MTERLPRPARAIHAIETSGNLVEIDLRLFVPPGEYAFEVELIGGVFGRLFGAPHGQFSEFACNLLGLRVEFVIRPFAFPP